MDLSDRKKKILSAVVERYIITGEPVGSKVLCGNLSVSSATVRNEMSELSDLGYLEQPHTSAGRIPSQRGLRFYVNNLMQTYEINDAERFSIESGFDSSQAEPEEVIRYAAKLLSDITGCASIASTPYDTHAVIKRVELVPVSSKAVLIVLLMSTGVIKSRICRYDADLDITSAELFYNIAAAHFQGRNPDELTMATMQFIAASLGDKAFAMTPLLFALYELSHHASEFNIITEGQSKLLNFKDLESDVYDIFECLKLKSGLTRILRAGNEDVVISIGTESMNRALKNASVISSKYLVGGKVVGSMGIIGPMRMDYARIVPSIKFISETVGKVLSEAIDE